VQERNLKLILHAELIPKFGGKCWVSEIQNKKRKLTAEMNRNLAVRLNLSTKILVRHYLLNTKNNPCGNNPEQFSGQKSGQKFFFPQGSKFLKWWLVPAYFQVKRACRAAGILN